MLRPPAAAIDGDDERFIAVECLDQVQAGLAGHRDRRGERVGQAKVGSGHARRGDPRGRPARMRIDQVVTALIGTRRGDRPGEIDDLGQAARRERVSDADPEGLAESQVAEARDVPGRVHDRAANAARAEHAERPLRGPPLHVSGGVDPPGHSPRVEPSAGQLARDGALLKDFGNLRRSLSTRDLPSPQPADRAVRFPRAEHRVRALEQRPRHGQLPGSAGACRGVRGIDVDGHDRAHHVFQVVNRAHGELGRPGHGLTTSRHWKPSV